MMQPWTARCMRVLLRFRMGTHSLPIVLSRRSGIPWDQRLCPHCTLHAVHDERYLLLNSLPCRLSGTVPCSALLRAACSCSGGSLILVGSNFSSWTVLTYLGQHLMLMMMVSRVEAHFHQPRRLDRYNHSVIQPACKPGGRLEVDLRTAMSQLLRKAKPEVSLSAQLQSSCNPKVPLAYIYLQEAHTSPVLRKLWHGGGPQAPCY